MLRVGSSFLLHPIFNTRRPEPHLTSKSVVTKAFLSYLGIMEWGPIWSGKYVLPSSQRMRLHELTSSDLGLMTRNPCELGFSPHSFCECIIDMHYDGRPNEEGLPPHKMCAIWLPMLLLLTFHIISNIYYHNSQIYELSFYCCCYMNKCTKL